jgi:hypothetical protein
MATELLYRSRCETKICTKCQQVKPRSEFPLHKGKERSRCKPCHSQDAMEWARSNGEKRRAYHRQWIAANRDKVRAYAKKHYGKRSPEVIQKKNEYRKRSHLARKYGMTQSDWDAMFAAQGGVCALCKVPGRVGKHGKLAVDHCHATGRVRGLLCTPCNISIGILGETPEQWEVVWRYLRGE